MYRFLVPVFLLLPFATDAQPRFELGLTGGAIAATSLTAVNTGAYKLKEAVYYEKAIGYNSTLKALLDLRKWQFGIGVEGGSMKGTLKRDLGYQYDIENNTLFHFYNWEDQPVEEQKIAAPYITPHLFMHFKFNFSDRVYLYTGPMGGRVFSKNDLSWDGKSTGWVAGGNLGVVVRLSDRLSIDIAEGWRMAWVRGAEIEKLNRRQWYNPKVVGQTYGTDNVAYSINSYKLSYAITAIGIRVTL